MTIPDFLSHYNRGEPFRTLSSLPLVRRAEVLKDLDETNTWGLGRFSDPEYLDRRLDVETRMRAAFVSKGGNPELDHPIYCFLGRNPKFEEDPRNRAYLIRLEEVPQNAVSFTYGDSLIAWNEDYRQTIGGIYLSDLCAQIFTLDELKPLLSRPDFHVHSGAKILHVEAQLWVKPRL